MGAGLFRSFWFYGDVDVSRGTWKLQSPGNMIQLLKTLMHVTIPWRFGKAS